MSAHQQWTCLACTYENQLAAQQCEMCEVDRPQNFSLRFRTPTDLFSLVDLSPHLTVEVLKIMIESKCGIGVRAQRLYYAAHGAPRRELFGRDTEAVMSVLEIKSTDDAPMMITVEIRKEAPTPTSATADAASAHWGGADADVADDDEDEFIAWLERPSDGAIVQPNSAKPSVSPPSTTATGGLPDAMSTTGDDENEDAEWGDDGLPAADGDDGWGDDADESAFMDDEDSTDTQLALAQKKHALEQKKAATVAVMQSSKDNKRLGVYDILSLSDVLVLMKKQLGQLEDAIGCTMAEAAILMRSYRWNQARLFEEYLDNPTNVQVKCGLNRMKLRAQADEKEAEHQQASASSGGVAASAAKPSLSLGECPLCGEEMTAANSLDLGCTADGSHRFCNVCWSHWCTSEMDKGPQALRTTCCSFQCREIIPDDTFLSLLAAKKRRLLSRWSLRNFVDSKPNLKWCVNSRCTKVLRYSEGGARDVECECGTRFCFSCALPESHSPCQCELVQKWTSKNSSDAGNNEWIVANTKACPGCKTAIEKNSGCAHMTCKQCKEEWCWLCRRPWSQHGSATGGYYSCNIYEEHKKTGVVSAEEQSQADAQARIAKYQFHFERFAEYEKSIKAALKQISETERRMELLQEWTGGGLQSVQFLLDANRTVVECRRALKWSYVIAYYLQPASRQLAMFQCDQGQLERFSDELHGLIELPLERLIPTATGPGAKATAAKAASTPAAAPSKSTVTTPTHASSSSTGSTSSGSTVVSPNGVYVVPAVEAPLPQGDDLRKLIEKKTSVANKYLSSLIDAVMGGQYIDLTLVKAGSIGDM